MKFRNPFKHKRSPVASDDLAAAQEEGEEGLGELGDDDIPVAGGASVADASDPAGLGLPPDIKVARINKKAVIVGFAALVAVLATGVGMSGHKKKATAQSASSAGSSQPVKARWVDQQARTALQQAAKSQQAAKKPARQKATARPHAADGKVAKRGNAQFQKAVTALRKAPGAPAAGHGPTYSHLKAAMKSGLSVGGFGANTAGSAVASGMAAIRQAQQAASRADRQAQNGGGIAAIRKAEALASGSGGAGGGGGSTGGNFYHSAASRANGNDYALKSSLDKPLTRYEIQAGSVIPAVLLTGINSEVQGQVVAQVSRPVYDSESGAHVLIPAGAKLIGQYSKQISSGQSRLEVAWTRVMFPSGRSMDLPGFEGADRQGYAGLHDLVHTHTLQTIGDAGLMSLVGAGAALASNGVNGGSQYSAPSISQTLESQLGTQLGQVMMQMIRKNMNEAATLQIRPGYRLNVIVTKDLVFHGATS